MTRNQKNAERIDSVQFEHCAACGVTLATDEWQPVEVVRARGKVRLLAFCDDDCREDFLSSQ